MLLSLLLGILIVVTLMLGWLLIQIWWGRIFAEYITDEDVMAGRTSCSNCGCTSACELKRRQFSDHK